MALSEKIKSIYPELTDSDFLKNVIVMNNSDGNGDFIAEWNHPTLSQPTQEQLDGV